MEATLKPKPSYSRRRPERTPCYKIIQEHYETFKAEREAEGRPLPEYVAEEFEAYLRCGILAWGFVRLKCDQCEGEMALAFSCKKRGWCPSCCAKRKTEAAMHLTENVLPFVAYRQYVVSFPIPLRYWLQMNRRLYSKVHSLVIKELHRYYIEKAKSEGIKDPTPGSISFSQRFGSALNLNPHMHVLMCDGVYSMVKERPKFHNIEPITDEQVAALISNISQSVMRHLKRKGYLDPEGEVVENPAIDELYGDHETLSMATTASIAGKIAFGPNAGKYVTKIGSGFGYGEEIPLAKGKRCYSINGFSLHANTSTRTHERDKLQKLIEYIARGPLSNERLEITEDGQVKLELKTKWSDGTTHLLFSPSEFIEKLCALIPPPKTHLVRWAGVFAPNSKYRKEIVLKPHIHKAFQFRDDEIDSDRPKNYRWAKVLKHVFKLDVMVCQKCGGDMTALAAIKDPFEVRLYLRHFGIDSDPPFRARARSVQGELDFDQSVPYED